MSQQCYYKHDWLHKHRKTGIRLNLRKRGRINNALVERLFFQASCWNFLELRKLLLKVEQKQKHRLKVIHAHYRIYVCIALIHLFKPTYKNSNLFYMALTQKPENSNIFQSEPTQSIYALSIPNPSLFQSHQLFPNRIQNGYIFSYKEEAQSLGGGEGTVRGGSARSEYPASSGFRYMRG